jgi:hypothetical protein
MVNFAESDYNRSQRAYESRCAEANASNQQARAQGRREKEDELVLGGQKALDEYKAFLDERWEAANCLAMYDGVSMGYTLLRRAQARLDAGE